MLRLQMKNCNMILAEKQQKFQHYHLDKFTYSPLGKAFKKQIKPIEDQGIK